MRLRLVFFTLLSAVAFGLATSESLYAKENSPQEVTMQKARILQSINLLRAMRGQRALTFFGGNAGGRQVRVAASTGTIAGRLNGIDQSAMQTAWVVAWSASADSGRASGGIGTVEPTGDYKLSDLPAGDYYVLASAEGYFPTYYKNALNFDEATAVIVTESSIVEGIDFDMQKILPGTASVSGVVLGDTDGLPISGAQVSVFSPDNPFLSGWAQTSANGTYQVTSLKSGTYYAAVWAEGYLSEYFDNVPAFEQATPIEVVEPEETKDIDFSLSTGGIISGAVTNNEGTPIPGAFVQAMPFLPDSTFIDPNGRGSYGWSITDERGQYRIGGLQTGSYVVFAQAWRQWDSVAEWYDNASTPEEATPVEIEVGKETPEINFQLDLPVANGVIAGKVTDLQDRPIAGAWVYAQAPIKDPSGGVQVSAYAYTEKDGSYRIENLPDGSYLVSASAFNQWQYVQRWWPDAESPDQAEPVILDSQSPPGPIDFHLPLAVGTVSIAGTVKTSDGRGLANAYIEVSSALSVVDPNGTINSSGVWAYGFTDSSGRYQVDNLPAGQYFVHAQYWEDLSFAQQWYDHADSREAATLLQVADGDRREGIDFDLTLRPIYGSIAGTVVNDANEVVISRAYIEISPQGYAAWDGAPFMRWPYYAITDEKGNYRLEWLPEGEYIVSVYANGAFEYFENAAVPELATSMKVVGGETAAVNFGLTPRHEGSGVISGRIGAEYTDQLLEIAVVVAKPVATLLIWPQSEMFFNAVINADGTYEISGLPAGEYYAMSFAPGYMAEYYKDQFDPSLAEVVKVDGTTPTTGIDFSLTPVLYLRGPVDGGPAGGGSVRGKVTDANARAIAGATVHAFNGEDQAISSTRSFADGTYELQGLPPGSYRLQASNLGFATQCNGGAEKLSEAESIELGRSRVEVNFVLNPQIITDVDHDAGVPRQMELYGNYPNPFNPETTISFGLPKAMRVKVLVFNVLGREVALLYDGPMSAGTQHLTWNGSDRSGRQLSSGLYFYRVEGGTTALTGKMLLMK